MYLQIRILPIVVVLSAYGCSCERIAENVEPPPSSDAKHVSGFSFPKSIGSFIRVDVHRYDSSGRNMSFGYDDFVNRIVATIYVYPASNHGKRVGLKRHIEELSADVIENHHKVQQQRPQPITMTIAGKKRNGFLAKFAYAEEFMGSMQDLQAELYLFSYDAYFVKYRFTYPASNAAVAEKAIEELIQSVAWPD